MWSWNMLKQKQKPPIADVLIPAAFHCVKHETREPMATNLTNLTAYIVHSCSLTVRLTNQTGWQKEIAPNRNIITNANVIWFFDIAKSTGTYSRIQKGLPRDVWFRPVFPPRRKELCACAVCSLLSFAFIFYDGHHFSITCQNGWPWHFCPCSSTFNTANAISSEGKGNGKE
jgi:hypothetical protein